MEEIWLGILRNLQCRTIALIGGGGKTGLMYYLLTGLKEKNLPVIATTTTKLWVPQGDNQRLVYAGDYSACTTAIASMMAQPQAIILAREPDRHDNRKIAGVPPEWLDGLCQEFPELICLVEADGSAGKSIKGHLNHEPVIPVSTDLVIPVIGIDCVGRSVKEAAHRPERFAEILAVSTSDAVTVPLVSTILLSPAGYLSRVPFSASIMPYINKVETPENARQCKELVQAILRHGGDRNIVGVMAGSLREHNFCYFYKCKMETSE